MELYWDEFLMLYLTNLLNLVSPGAGFAITARNATAYSRKIGIITGLGIVCSSLIHKTYTFLGLGLIVSSSPVLFNVIKFLGSFYLVYLGSSILKTTLKTMRTDKDADNIPDSKRNKKNISYAEAFSNGFFTDLLNPQASLNFILLVSATVSPATPMKIQLWYCVALLLTSVVWYTLVALAFTGKSFKVFFQKYAPWIDVFLGFIVIFLGLKLLLMNQAIKIS